MAENIFIQSISKFRYCSAVLPNRTTVRTKSRNTFSISFSRLLGSNKAQNSMTFPGDFPSLSTIFP